MALGARRRRKGEQISRAPKPLVASDFGALRPRSIRVVGLSADAIQCGRQRPDGFRGRLCLRVFAGAGTHPGAGLPGVVNSAKLLEKLVAKI